MALKPYVIKQGDYLAKLAFAMNFKAEDVWNDPKNAELAGKRDPNMLLPGDVLWVPDEPPPPKPMQGGTANDYSADVPKTKLRLVFGDERGPFVAEPYELKGVPDAQPGQTGASGEVELEVPVTLREFELLMTKRKITYCLHVGNMDPIEEPAGVRKRLRNLGYWHGHGMDEAEMKQADCTAIAAFQRDNGIEPSGQLDDATKSALMTSHGS
jgi:hypothetical protein